MKFRGSGGCDERRVEDEAPLAEVSMGSQREICFFGGVSMNGTDGPTFFSKKQRLQGSSSPGSVAERFRMINIGR